ncbi:TonB-dependent siderophore receptor, partial [Vacuolonema iberomarrocanum]|uniref:TonB-dependent siderophore receptor n=1 Tax=Vacuolonema iberomarrocanum TaxID=3454632 RepID=UPI001A0AEA3A|nr:TonB-dependent siderophore receptor [filamentous cyanobacterium LEGE 07170]
SPTLPLPHSPTLASSQLAQSQTAPTQIIDVQLEETETGLQVLLETPDGELLAPTTTVSGNALTAEIANAVLALPEDEEFLAFEPTEAIALIQVSALPGNRVQVVITGTDAPPTGTVEVTATGLALSIMPGVAQVGEDDDALRVVVTGEDDRDYAEPTATTATRTDTPLIEIPQSIQVIPEAVLEDQRVIRLNDALRNAPGVVQENNFGGGSDRFTIRGFQGAAILRDGFRANEAISGLQETANLERIEVLRGPASILYGNVEPGGVINLVTERPLPEFAGEVGLQLGSFDLFRPTLDVSGPLTDDGDLLYRLNVAYEYGDGFRDFDTNVERVFVAPVVEWRMGDRTNLIVDLEYTGDQRPYDRGIPPLGDEMADVPLDTIVGEPDDFFRTEITSVGYRLEHRFSENWQIRNRFRYTDNSFVNRRTQLEEILGGLNEETGEITRLYYFSEGELESYEFQTEVIGEFTTGSINHTLLAGIDVFFADSEFFVSNDLAPPVNLFDPEIGVISRPDLPLAFTTTDTTTNRSQVGLLLQDQIELLPEVILLLGGRVDFFTQSSTAAAVAIPGIFETPARDNEQSQTAFTPRVGIVYQPIEELALYASYSRSFQPNILTATTADNEFLDPEEGEQFEVGLKTELFDGRLAATLSFFDITQTNVAATDPDNTNFVVPIGEQTSRGMEFNVTGEILPGWNILAGLSVLDAEIEESVNFPAGAAIPNVPETSASLWTTYEIQSGRLTGLGFGLGLYYVGDRQGDNENSFTLDEYLRTDAAIYYRQDSFRLGLNFRNLFDIDYFESTEAGRGGSIPGEPFTVIGSISITF